MTLRTIGPVCGYQQKFEETVESTSLIHNCNAFVHISGATNKPVPCV